MTNGRTSHFKWKELQPQFENIANTKLYSHKVLKNKYDEMRREYINWISLKNEEIGVPGNENKENDKVGKIRKKQPSAELQEAWHHLYGDIVTELRCVSPSMDPSPLNEMHPVNAEEEVLGASDDADAYSEHSQDNSRLENLQRQEDEFFPSLINEIRGENVSTSNQIGGLIKPIRMKRRRRESPGAVMFKEFMSQQYAIQQRFVRILEEDAHSDNQVDKFSVSAAISVINRMVDDGLIAQGSDLWIFALNLLEDAVKREVFLSLKKDDGRLVWLNHKQKIAN